MNEIQCNIVKKSIKRERPNKFERMKLLIQEMEILTEASFTGYVKINFSQGSIGRVEKFEEILKDLKYNEKESMS